MITRGVVIMIGLLWLFGISLIPIGCSIDRVSSAPVEDVSKLKRIGDVPARENGWFKIQFINEQEGWLGCGKRLWQTIDGGRNWEAIYLTRDSISELEFTSSQTGWMLVSGKFLKTENGGYTWTQQENVPLSSPKARLNDVKFMKDGKTGWIIGGLYQAEPQKGNVDSFLARFPATAIFRTDDGGISWVRENISSPLGGRHGRLFLLDHQVWAIDEAGFFYRKANEGRWEKADYARGNCDRRMLLHTTQKEGGDIFAPIAVYFLDVNQGWLSFQNGYMAKTMDGGRTWCDLLDLHVIWPKRFYDTFFSKIHFAGPTHGWGLSAEGNVYETNDGGSNWQKLNLNAKIEDIHFLDSNMGWAVAKESLFRIIP